MAIFSLENLSEATYWVGANDTGTNDTFVWIATNEVLPIDSTLWNQPITSDFHDLDCVVLINGIGKLIPYNCEFETNFICEKPRAPSISTV